MTTAHSVSRWMGGSSPQLGFGFLLGLLSGVEMKETASGGSVLGGDGMVQSLSQGIFQ